MKLEVYIEEFATQLKTDKGIEKDDALSSINKTINRASSPNRTKDSLSQRFTKAKCSI